MFLFPYTLMKLVARVSFPCDLSRQASLDGFQLNEAKCKVLRIGFSNNNYDFEPLVLNGKPLELVTSAKLLGVTISHDLKWTFVSIFYVNSRDPE